VDSNFKGNHILKEAQARRRVELITDVDYVFSLALNHGDYYLGQVQITFVLKQMPENDHELFINSQAMAIADLKINEHHITEESGFKSQTIALTPDHLKEGENTVSLRYLTPYGHT